MAAEQSSPKTGLSPLVLSALALALFVAAMMWALAGPGDEPEVTPTADTHAEAAPVAVTANGPGTQPRAGAATAAQPTAPLAPEVDLFAGEMPDFMANSHARVLDKKPLGAPEQKALYDYGKANPNDARPQLLLAWDSMNREWDGIAVRMYRIAFRADVRAKQDPSMLRDLIKVASNHDKVEFRETAEILREAFGSEALGPIEEELERVRATHNATRVARLERLRDEITKPAAP